jgi:hypothetical protein
MKTINVLYVLLLSILLTNCNNSQKENAKRSLLINQIKLKLYQEKIDSLISFKNDCIREILILSGDTQKLNAYGNDLKKKYRFRQNFQNKSNIILKPEEVKLRRKLIRQAYFTDKKIIICKDSLNEIKFRIDKLQEILNTK